MIAMRPGKKKPGLEVMIEAGPAKKDKPEGLFGGLPKPEGMRDEVDVQDKPETADASGGIGGMAGKKENVFVCPGCGEKLSVEPLAEDKAEDKAMGEPASKEY